ncbi:hypothetical protein SLA2020_424550 [Shorea laevis]
MELPQPCPLRTEAGRKPTHDFLSLYSHSTVQQDPRPPSQGGYLKTHDFLKPLERVGKTGAKEEAQVEVSTAEKRPPSAPSPYVEHILPGGIGTYSISHISHFTPRVPKPEGTIFTVAQGSSTHERNDENSNCSSYTGSEFTLWEESAAKKGKTGKENAGESAFIRDGAGKVGPWTASLERASQSSTNNHRNSFSSLSSSQPSSGQKSQSFMEMIKSAKANSQDEDLDEDEDFHLKKESSTTTTINTHSKGELRVKVDGKSAPDQKANTPRSKHSATEQRRRSKINDRFQMLREIIPHSDQKRDKASFLLEVIEYIQFLQEKVHKYEGSYQGWSHEPGKLMPWRNNHKIVESYADQSRVINTGSSPALVFSSKLDEKNITVSPTIPRIAHNPVESDMSQATSFKAMDHCPGLTNKPMPFPVSLQPDFFTSAQSSGAAAQLPPRLASNTENACQSQPVSCHTGTCTRGGTVTNDKLKENELTIEGGTISISSVYSQGLLNTLTKALQSCGVDLSQASISVQIDLGKQSSSRPTASTSTLQDNEVRTINQGMMRSRVSCGEDSEQALKKLKTGKS